MGVNSICELGDDEDVRAVSTMAAAFQETALTSLIEDAKQQGEVSDAVDARAAARFLATILSGMRVQAKVGASVEALRDVAAFAAQESRVLDPRNSGADHAVLRQSTAPECGRS